MHWLLFLIKDGLFLLGYVSGQSSFPKPLTHAEEQRLLKDLFAGSEDARRKLREALEKIINEGSGGMICILL